MLKNVTDTVFYVGVDDKDIDLFENQYIVPNGIAYNSYVIMDEKIAIMDMVDSKCADQWFANVAEVLGDRKPDYLIILPTLAMYLRSTRISRSYQMQSFLECFQTSSRFLWLTEV